jgi:aconitate hydratase
MIPTARLASGGQSYRIVDLPAAAGSGLARLPYLHRILLENLLRHNSDPETLGLLPGWLQTGASDAEVEYYPGRILMHDTTCGPALVDIAASRSALDEAGADAAQLNPVLKIDVSTDHSVAVDYFASPDARARNMAMEMSRNAERYRFMKWATGSLENVTVHPPGTGIMHTINMEKLASVVTSEIRNGEIWAKPDTLIGTDSHTPMINGIGVLGWGVGGLEAEGVMFGMPVIMRVPKVVGVKLTGKLADGVLATDLALVVTSRLRALPVSGRYVEFFGPGVSTLSAGERCVVANMTPEFGGATGYFPIDAHTLDYLAATGRDADAIALVEAYAKRQGLWFDGDAVPVYDEVLELDLSAVQVSLAGPKRPQDRLSPSATRDVLSQTHTFKTGTAVPDGAVAIAAITSCTNTSDPRLVVAAGLLARKAREKGLRSQSWVKTSLAPGSPTAERYLTRAGLLDDLEAMGFGIVAYGCTTCIGNSGPLTDMLNEAVKTDGILPTAVLSGNRNFPGRVHPGVDMAFLASPPLVVAYAIAGDMNRDILSDPIGTDKDGKPVTLADVWPSGAEIDAALAAAARVEDYASAYASAEDNEAWRALDAPQGVLYPWDADSTYLRRPPFAAILGQESLGHYTAVPLLVLGDDITTDHISPAGQIPRDSEAAAYLIARREDPNNLNVFSSRRGNWEVMLRGLFTNKAVRNLLGANIPPGSTIHAPSGEVMALYKAAERYRAEDIRVVIVAGERYGMGSSRDWAAKGASLLGARAVLAASFEGIHRANLINMGILPLCLPKDRHPTLLNLAVGDRIEIDAPPDTLVPRHSVPVAIHRAGGAVERFTAMADVETKMEVAVLARGGIIPLILQTLLEKPRKEIIA